ncbi:MAG TPA: transcriptional regulator [Micromonosporaceae bacterium]|nr:transcriptional regulator [Micromonosporaceae bacterium]
MAAQARQMPMLRRRRTGLTLRKLRERQGLNLKQVAELMECSQSKISRIETGQSSARVRDVRDLLAIYGVTGQVAEDIMNMAREALRHERERTWWHPYNNVLISAYVGNENAASRVRTYEHQCVPGLLQTEEYALALFRTAAPTADSETIAERLRVRMGRQMLLTRDGDPLKLDAVLDEAVLSRPVGGDSVMRGQLQRLIAATTMPNVVLRLLPFDVGAHAGMDGTFAILDYAEADGSSIVYAEHATGGLFLDKERELKLYSDIFDRIQAKALGPEQTRERLASLADQPRWQRF